MFASWLKSSLWDTQRRICIWFWKNFLNLLAVEFGIVISVFWRIECFHHDWTYFCSNSCQTSTQIFIAFKVCSNVERWSMTIEEISEVSMYITHIIDNKTGKLHGSCFNSSLSIVKQSKIWSWKGPVSFLFFNKSNFNIIWKESKFTFDIVSSFLP